MLRHFYKKSSKLYEKNFITDYDKEDLTLDRFDLKVYHNTRQTSPVLTRRTSGFTAKQKQIGLQNYFKFGPVKVSPMKLLVKDFKIQKSA